MKLAESVVPSTVPLRLTRYPATRVSSVLTPQLRLIVDPTTVATRFVGIEGAVVSVTGGCGTVTDALLLAADTLPAPSMAATE